MSKEVTIEEWYRGMEKSLNGFIQDRRDKTKKDSDQYPVSMGLGDWDEEFHYYLNKENDELGIGTDV